MSEDDQFYGLFKIVKVVKNPDYLVLRKRESDTTTTFQCLKCGSTDVSVTCRCHICEDWGGCESEYTGIPELHCGKCGNRHGPPWLMQRWAEFEAEKKKSEADKK